MFGNVSAESAALEMTFEDRADLVRMCDSAENRSITTKIPIVVSRDLRCGISYIGMNSSRQSNRSSQSVAQNVIDHSAVVFFRAGVDVRCGDLVRVRRFGEECETDFAVVGIPLRFATHTEVRVREQAVG